LPTFAWLVRFGSDFDALSAKQMTWADDGRATFGYGNSLIADEPHILWRRVGTHAILHRP
jgi:hypothetical protein